MEEVTLGSRILMPAAFFFLFVFRFPLQAQRPSARYQAATEAGRLEPRVRAWVVTCLKTEKLPKPIQLYSQGAWFVIPDLAAHIREQGSSDDGTAQVWELNSKPRAVSMWTRDDEFDRNTFACLNESGVVTRQINEYMPGLSEPDLRWISIHTFTLAPGGKYKFGNRYTDWSGHAIPAPVLTSEDRDFITGERRYARWKDFDLASAFDRQQK